MVLILMNSLKNKPNHLMEATRLAVRQIQDFRLLKGVVKSEGLLHRFTSCLSLVRYAVLKGANVKSKIIIFTTLLFITSCTDQSDKEINGRKEVEQIIKIHYKYDFANEINTFNKTCTKDLVLGGVITMDYWFQLEEQDTIIKVIEEIDFFNLPDTLSYQPEDSISVVIEPDPGIQSLRINYNNQDKTVYWYIVNSFPSEYEIILRITTLLEEILHSDPEYQSLPEPIGGYI